MHRGVPMSMCGTHGGSVYSCMVHNCMGTYMPPAPAPFTYRYECVFVFIGLWSSLILCGPMLAHATTYKCISASIILHTNL